MLSHRELSTKVKTARDSNKEKAVVLYRVDSGLFVGTKKPQLVCY